MSLTLCPILRLLYVEKKSFDRKTDTSFGRNVLSWWWHTDCFITSFFSRHFYNMLKFHRSILYNIERERESEKNNTENTTKTTTTTCTTTRSTIVCSWSSSSLECPKHKRRWKWLHPREAMLQVATQFRCWQKKKAPWPQKVRRRIASRTVHIIGLTLQNYVLKGIRSTISDTK